MQEALRETIISTTMKWQKCGSINALIQQQRDRYMALQLQMPEQIVVGGWLSRVKKHGITVTWKILPQHPSDSVDASANGI